MIKRVLIVKETDYEFVPYILFEKRGNFILEDLWDNVRFGELAMRHQLLFKWK